VKSEAYITSLTLSLSKKVTRSSIDSNGNKVIVGVGDGSEFGVGAGGGEGSGLGLGEDGRTCSGVDPFDDCDESKEY
jgi:hypothetical protein